ncbi:MAG TPA: RIP metalloprotease RseP [Thermoanaerobaculia bacterium]|nr:RIP metalloprotease RseP [Thermoanaerobaculia bacterium]
MSYLTGSLYTLLSFAFALGVIIVVHEAGHLLVAKAFGVRVMTFSVGFGKRLWGFQRGETEYRVSAVPLGGYVRLGGESPEDVDPTDPREFLNKPRWQRILVYLAGPAANIILAILVFSVVFMVGIEVMSFPDMPALIGGVEASSSAAQAGLRRGDRILTVKGEPVESWQDVLLGVMGSPDRPVPLTIRRGQQTLAATVTPKLVPRYEVGDLAGMIPMVRPQVIEIVKGQPAEAAGFRPGDEIRAVDGKPVIDSQAFVDAISPRAGQQIGVQVLRDGRPLTLTVVPRNDNGSGRIGVKIGFYQRFGPSRAFVEGARYSAQTVEQIFQILGKIFTRQLSAKGALAGPLEIAKQSGEAARLGFKYLLQLMGFISISIAVMNLMPIPILDGGQIFILMVEGVIRRDLSLRLKEIVSQVGFVMILLLMFVVIYFDVMKSDFVKHLLGG